MIIVHSTGKHITVGERKKTKDSISAIYGLFCAFSHCPLFNQGQEKKPFIEIPTITWRIWIKEYSDLRYYFNVKRRKYMLLRIPQLSKIKDKRQSSYMDPQTQIKPKDVSLAHVSSNNQHLACFHCQDEAFEE